ncbi:putative toxin-antitoxin system toxin component, PIN family [Halochromatium glycolicum]|uniref:Toxin-antitoxin system toxin component, PIN family n=1 Tax=Halochromatium glycolicum TaxID=85075 RepID=A0AAJ0X8A2_9GAMM|nr:putative toxin-antitoxin system toxin component, PIN family [Halochromatium glycolicum]MBK1703744.1 putative toxin-antitoxin system toxin component, PIN family [Halochromatium glycolicum]
MSERAARVVIDTNVFLGALLTDGAANAVIAACLRGQLLPLMGSTLLAEYEDILSREPLFARARLDASEREELLDIFLSHCVWTPVYFGWRPNLADEGDNHLVELAVAGRAQTIITRNRHDFARMELRFPAVTLRSPEECLQELTV